MTRFRLDILANFGVISFLSGTVMLVCFAALIPLPSLRGQTVIPFLVYAIVVSLAYFIAVARTVHDRFSLTAIWVFAVLFRLVLLATTPTLSDDVFRYIWDGHLVLQGINPYVLPVNSPALDGFDTALRGIVNHPWMASPYLPAAQIYFSLVEWMRPQSVFAYQIGALGLDLLSGWLVMDLLHNLALPRRRVIIYLWNPLVIFEFAHGAHMDALMILFMVAAFWFILRAKPASRRRRSLKFASAVSLAVSTLTKAVTGFLVPLFLRRWGWQRIFGYLLVVTTLSAVFAWDAGLGLTGELDGTGLFGAIRIYLDSWNFNSGLYHMLEVTLSGYSTSGAVPVEVVGEASIRLAKTITRTLFLITIIGAGIWAWRWDDPDKRGFNERSLGLLRLATVPMGAYLLLTTTVNPWYVTMIVPLLPFLLPSQGERAHIGRFIWPWLYFSSAVLVSYLTYLDPNDLREYGFVRWIEYVPFYLLLVWAAWPYFMRLSSRTRIW